MRLGEEAARTGKGNGEWSGAQAQYALAVALINAGRREAGRDAMAQACNNLKRPMLDQRSLLAACEVMADVEAGRGHQDEASRWAGHAMKVARAGQEASAALARAHALRATEPRTAAAAAGSAAQSLATAGLLIDAGRARLCAGRSYAATGLDSHARTELAVAAQMFSDCGARSLLAAAVREQRRLGVRVPGPTTAGRAPGPHGLTQRELDVVDLVREGYTNQQIAGSLFVSIRTVETHLSHAFAKLGVSSRTGLLKALSEV